MSYRLEQSTYSGVTEPHGCRRKLVHDGGIEGVGVGGATVQVDVQRVHDCVPQNYWEILLVGDVLYLGYDDPPRLLIDDLVPLRGRPAGEPQSEFVLDDGGDPVVFPQEERVEGGQCRLDDGSLVPRHQVGGFLRRDRPEPALLPGGQTGTPHGSVDHQQTVPSRPQPARRVLVRAVDVAAVYEGGDAVELLPHVLAVTPAVGPRERVAVSARTGVELVLRDVNVETSLQRVRGLLL